MDTRVDACDSDLTVLSLFTAPVGARLVARLLDRMLAQRGIDPPFIRPSHPIGNAVVESFNGEFRDDCSNERWIVSLAAARFTIDCWR